MLFNNINPVQPFFTVKLHPSVHFQKKPLFCSLMGQTTRFFRTKLCLFDALTLTENDSLTSCTLFTTF
ncbi:hypothetical protein EDP1_1184 [Pseudomonas putida S610]|nr:hypothetical protein EDP1_1184 [Pseudomonas putida S610]